MLGAFSPLHDYCCSHVHFTLQDYATMSKVGFHSVLYNRSYYQPLSTTSKRQTYLVHNSQRHSNIPNSVTTPHDPTVQLQNFPSSPSTPSQDQLCLNFAPILRSPHPLLTCVPLFRMHIWSSWERRDPWFHGRQVLWIALGLLWLQWARGAGCAWLAVVGVRGGVRHILYAVVFGV